VDENPFAAQGLIQPDGTFRLGTTRPGEGAIPGKYRVLIEPSGEEGVNAETSEPEFTVVAGVNHFTITAQKPEKKKARNKN
jgi:hypothetical protein